MCGPAAYFYCLLKERRDLYIRAVKGLWEEGQVRIGQLEIKAGDVAKPSNFFDKKGNPKISGIDWVTMGSLRDSDNFFWIMMTQLEICQPLLLHGQCLIG